MKFRSWPLVGVGVIAAALLTGNVIAGGSAHRDVFVGTSASSGLSASSTLSLANDNPAVIFLTEVDGILEGWADSNPGWNAATDGTPGLAPMEPGAALFFEVNQFTTSMKIYDSVFQELHEHGDLGELGGHDMHTHYTWLIDRADGDFDPERVGWRGSYRVIDMGTTGYGIAQDAMFFRPDACENVLEGDADQDGVVTPFDLQAFWSVVNDPSGASLQQLCACDTNHDGIASSDDAPSFLAALRSVSLF